MRRTAAEIGALGEQLATDYLRTNGFYIRDRNWRAGRYEIDIIAERWDCVHFVEVKCRKAGGYTTPESAITPNKFQALTHAASAYISSFGIEQEVQFDLIAIDLYDDDSTELRYIEHAMEFRW